MYYRVQQPAAPLRETRVSTSSLTRRPKTTSDRPAKPPNAFILFRTAYNQAGRELARTITELTSVSTRTALQQGNVSRDAAEAWRALGEDGRKEWEEKADMLRYEHEQRWGDKAYRASKYNLRVEGEGVLETSGVVRSKNAARGPPNTPSCPASSKRKTAMRPQGKPLCSAPRSQLPAVVVPLPLQTPSSYSATPTPPPPSPPSASANPYGSWIGYPLPPYYYFAYYPVIVMASPPSMPITPSPRIPEGEGDDDILANREKVADGRARYNMEEMALANVLLREDAEEQFMDIDIPEPRDADVSAEGAPSLDGNTNSYEVVFGRRSSPPPACIDPRLLLE